jgi:tRNA threonylcarbamoyladenosine biosynthesis protein TsaE
MNALVYDAASEAATDRIGSAVAAVLAPGTTIALCGTLGAGKTRFAQGLAAACGIPREDVVSPTFVLCQQYDGTRTIQHLDAYRLHDEDELRELGIEELIASADITIIEWADRVPDALPDEHLRIEIEVTGPTSRRFRVQWRGAAARSPLPRLHALLAGGPIG